MAPPRVCKKIKNKSGCPSNLDDSERKTLGQRDHQEASVLGERSTGFYIQQRYTCASHQYQKILHTSGLYGGKKKASSQKGPPGVAYEVCTKTPDNKLAEAFVVRWRKSE